MSSLHHCIEVLSRYLLASGFDWRSLAGVFADGEGVTRRFHPIGSGARQTFRWDPIIGQFMKHAFPGFKKAANLVDDALVFLKPIDDVWSAAVVFDKHPEFESVACSNCAAAL